MNIGMIAEEMRALIDGHRSITEPVEIELHTLEAWLLEIECLHGDGTRQRPGDPHKAIREIDAAAAVADAGAEATATNTLEVTA